MKEQLGSSESERFECECNNQNIVEETEQRQPLLEFLMSEKTTTRAFTLRSVTGLIDIS